MALTDCYNSGAVSLKILTAPVCGGAVPACAANGAAGFRRGIGRTISDDYQLSTAFHEAGHIAANAAVGLAPIVFATVNPSPGRAGYVQSPPLNDDNQSCERLYQFSAFALHDIRRPPLPKVIDGNALSPRVAVVLYARTIVALAGGETVRMCFSGFYDPVRDRSDVEHAEFYARRVTGDPVLFLRMAREDARRIIAAQSHQVEAVADALVQLGSLNAGEIAAVMARPMVPDAIRRHQWNAMAANAAQFTANFGELKRMAI